MKTRVLFRLLLVTGLFGLININLLAQEVVVSTGEAEPLLRARALERSASRDAGSSYFYSYGQERSSRLSLSKNFNKESTDKDGEFKVEEEVTRMKINIQGHVSSGTIKVTLLLPSGEVYKDLTLDDSADLEWSSSFSIEEGVKKYHGAWIYKIKAVNAEGMYQLSITTY
jgi:hypothetical protein